MSCEPLNLQVKSLILYTSSRASNSLILGMPMFASQFDKLLAKATDESVTEPDWMAMMAMCDLVRQQEVFTRAADYYV